MEDKYWKDYTQFIQTTEKLAGLSPADLLSLYETLIEELENPDRDIFEWIYENANEKYTRTKIQLILDSDDLKDNMLKNEFLEKIKALDRRIQKFLKIEYVNDKEIWKSFSDDVIDWEKVKKAK